MSALLLSDVVCAIVSASVIVSIIFSVSIRASVGVKESTSVALLSLVSGVHPTDSASVRLIATVGIPTLEHSVKSLSKRSKIRIPLICSWKIKNIC